MPTRPDDVDALIDATLDADALAEVVERHLDAHPLPVDEAELARAVDRLANRLPAAPRRSRAPWVFAAALLAASALVALRPESSGGVLPVATELEARPLVIVEPPLRVHAIDAVDEQAFVTARRTVELAPGSQVLSAERGRTAVLLVQRGEARAEDAVVPEAHWGLLTRTPDGVAHAVVFPDGAARPALPDAVWHAGTVDEQLRALRWQALPSTTLDTLESLLEAP